jgi:hypothetical protein
MNRAELIKNLHDELDTEPSLSPQISDQINEVMQTYIDALLRIETGNKSPAPVDKIDFPQYVFDLIQGTFEAIVDATIQQMDAYTELLEKVTKSIDQFMTNNISDNDAGDYLTEDFKFDFIASTHRGSNDQYNDCEELKHILTKMGIKLAIECPPTEKQLETIREALELRSRQKLLTTMVMMGINHIVVSDEKSRKGRINID